jgi:hypothetical protein
LNESLDVLPSATAAKLKTKKQSEIKKDDVENKLLNDFRTDDFVRAIELEKEIVVGDDLGSFIYNEIFDPKAYFNT